MFSIGTTNTTLLNLFLRWSSSLSQGRRLECGWMLLSLFLWYQGAQTSSFYVSELLHIYRESEKKISAPLVILRTTSLDWDILSGSKGSWKPQSEPCWSKKAVLYCSNVFFSCNDLEVAKDVSKSLPTGRRKKGKKRGANKNKGVVISRWWMSIF